MAVEDMAALLQNSLNDFPASTSSPVIYPCSLNRSLWCHHSKNIIKLTKNRSSFFISPSICNKIGDIMAISYTSWWPIFPISSFEDLYRYYWKCVQIRQMGDIILQSLKLLDPNISNFFICGLIRKLMIVHGNLIPQGNSWKRQNWEVWVDIGCWGRHWTFGPT